MRSLKREQCIRTGSKLENGLMYLYQVFKFNEVNSSTTFTKYKL